MLLKSNTFLDQTNRFASATNTLDVIYKNILFTFIFQILRYIFQIAETD